MSFQNSTTFSIDGSITGVTIFDPSGTTPVDVVHIGDQWFLKIDWEIHNSGCSFLNSGYHWKVSVYLEGMGAGAPEVDVNPVTVPAVTGPSNYSSGLILMPLLPEGAYESVALIQLYNGNVPMAVAGNEELPLVQIFA